MGTRGLTAVILDGERKIAQYGQWDHYPSGQGLTVLAFCRDVMADDAKRETFIANLRRCRFSCDSDVAERKEWLSSIGVDDGWMTMEQGARFGKRYPLLSRDHGAKILGLVAAAGDDPIILDDSWTFGADSLFCEWAYVLDVTAGTIEVYRGFAKDGSIGRFADLVDKTLEDSKYGPVSLVKTYRISELPTDADFVRDLKVEK